MKLKQFYFKFKVIFTLIFCLSLICILPVNVKADINKNIASYDLNDEKDIHFLPWDFDGYMNNSLSYLKEKSIDSNSRFSENSYNIIYKYKHYNEYDKLLSPQNMGIKILSNNQSLISFAMGAKNSNLGIVPGRYIEYRSKMSGNLSNFVNNMYISSPYDTNENLKNYNYYYKNNFSMNSSIGLNTTTKYNDIYISSYLLSDNESGNEGKINFSFNSNIDNKFIDKRSKLYIYMISNTSWTPKLLSLLKFRTDNYPVFEELRILNYDDIDGDYHNSNILSNKQHEVLNYLKNELLYLQNQVNNNSQYDSETKDYINYKLNNIFNYNENDIKHIVNQTNYDKNYDESVLNNIDDIKEKTSKDMNDYLNKKVLSIEQVPNLDFGKQESSYTHNMIANVQNNPTFKIKSFNNGGWHMILSLSDMSNGKNYISSSYFKGNNSSYTNNNKIFSYSGNDGIRSISLNDLSINIPAGIKLSSGNYRGTATWNLSNGPN